MTSTIDYKGYVARIAYDHDAARIVGSVVNAGAALRFEADAASEVLARFHAVIDDYLAECTRQGVSAQRPFSGRLLLRIDPALHGELAAAAARRDSSINRYAELAIRRMVEADRAGADGPD